jgi:long-chain fatty acid transport protein
MYGVLKDDVGINNALPSLQDGQLSVSSNDVGFGGNFGALWEVSDNARFGVTYTTPVEFDFVDRPAFTNLGPVMEAALEFAGLLDTDLSLGITVPQTVMASFYYDLNADWALMGDIGWQDWSQFGGINVEVTTDPPTSLAVELQYKDTWHGALGAKRRLSDVWLLSFGIGYDSSMMEDANRSLTLPVGQAWRFAAGAQHQFTEKFELGFGYTFMAIGNMPVDQDRGPLSGRVAGTYESAAIHSLSLQGHWKF